MPSLHVNTAPSRRDLIVFGSLLPAFFALVGWSVMRHHAPFAWVAAVWAIGAAATAAYWAMPAIRRPALVGAAYATAPIGLVISLVVLGAVFFLALTPVGLIMRLSGYDPLQRRFDPRPRNPAGTYWVRRRPPGPASRYFRQF